MTDLLAKVEWALRARKENLALDEDLEHLAHDMARALIAAGELATVATAMANRLSLYSGGTDDALVSYAESALAAFRAEAETEE